MTVTVSHLCKLPVFSGGLNIVAGRGGLNRQVNHVTVMEAPDFAEWVNGNEFILSTLYSFRNDIDLIVNVVRQLAEKKIAALAVKINRFINEIPPVIISLADEYDLPLFAVKREVKFREVISAISTEIINRQLRIIKDVNNRYEELLSHILKGDSIATFVNMLGSDLKCSCLCISLSGEVLASHLDKNNLPENFVDNALKAIGELKKNKTVHTRLNDFYLFPCLAQNKVMGYVVVAHPGEMDDRAFLLTRQMVSFLSIKLLEKHLMIETEQRMLASLVDEVLFRESSDEATLRDRVKLLGLKPQEYHFVLLLAFRHEISDDILQISIRQWVSRLRNLFPESAVFLKGNEIIGIVSLPGKSPLLDPNSIKRNLLNLMNEGIAKPQGEVDLGYSFAVKEICRLKECYEQARKAISIGRAFKPQNNVFFYGEFLKEALILRGIGSHEYNLLIKQLIDPLKKYDQKYNTELWPTLEKCLLVSSLEKVAQDLHIHISTLRYRLQRIYEITGVDYFTVQGKFLLNLAYIAEKLNAGQA
ncbi:MAG: hypothetical protein HPY89_10320 [Pelotomaculum sp.]|uniref:Regulator of polyketide synthase expression n=1 Tax=Pelotomaculum thermopropionicum (strain DSM 13744 / JCM 10971 / SI) TaxID=370438 RepID=A5D5M5_PELTS|nr:hypothetical protein [Pelotomaculum sp.]BAF58447.1 regulator of polyketide synthase expression [Pelotomaculum thermopropionicum SI]